MQLGIVMKVVDAYYITTDCPYCGRTTSGMTVKKESERMCRYCKQPYKVKI